MADGSFIAYYRVSTAKQGASGLGLEAQKDAVAKFLNGGRWRLTGEFVEIESGKRNDRPALVHALRMCRLNRSTLVIAKLDRLARNVAFISNLMESGVEFTAVDFPEANRLMIHVLASVAEHEVAMISARTKAALGAAKARGVVLGGDRGRRLKIASQAIKGARASARIRGATANKRASDLFPLIEEIKNNGAVSLRQIAERLNAHGIACARGGRWSAVQVQRVLPRFSLLSRQPR